MSLRTKHILDHANKLAVEHYREPYYKLPQKIQRVLFSMGIISARNEIKELVKNNND